MVVNNNPTNLNQTKINFNHKKVRNSNQRVIVKNEQQPQQKLLNFKKLPPSYSYFPKKYEKSINWNFNVFTQNKIDKFNKKIIKSRTYHYSIRSIIHTIYKFYYNRLQPIQWKELLENKENFERFQLYEEISIQENQWFLKKIKYLYQILEYNFNFYSKYLYLQNKKPNNIDKYIKLSTIHNQIYGPWIKKHLSKKEILDLDYESFQFCILKSKLSNYFNLNKNNWPIYPEKEDLYFDALQEILIFILTFNLDSNNNNLKYNINVIENYIYENDEFIEFNDDSDSSDNEQPNFNHQISRNYTTTTNNTTTNIIIID